MSVQVQIAAAIIPIHFKP